MSFQISIGSNYQEIIYDKMITVVIYPNKRKITDFLTRRNGERRNGERELKQSVSRFQSSLNANLLKKKKERK